MICGEEGSGEDLRMGARRGSQRADGGREGDGLIGVPPKVEKWGRFWGAASRQGGEGELGVWKDGLGGQAPMWGGG